MCVIFFYANSNPKPNGYKLILASNRDEFFNRETRSVAKWANAEHVYGGIDLEPGREGGTWLAISALNGVFKVGALLNLTGEPKPRDSVAHNNILQTHRSQNDCNTKNFSSTTTTTNKNNSTNSTATSTNKSFLLGRGMIVADYVSSSAEEFNIEQYNKRLVNDCAKYSAFNFVSIEIGQPDTPATIHLLSNAPATLLSYEEGKCYGFGNSLPDAPFEKVRFGMQHFTQIVDALSTTTPECHHELLVKDLMQLLKEKRKFWPDSELLRRAPSWGENLSALNVYIPQHEYGSRTHTVILVDANNKMHIFEETMLEQDPAGKWQCSHIEKQYNF